jgi:hypothetical protein
MKEKFIGDNEQILIKIPKDICKLYNLKPDLEFEITAVERPNSKLLISILCDINNG